MENTTATLLNEYVQQTPRELLDAYYDKGQSTIVHELFHQWFGCLVTCESWSNQAVDETFAEFSDVLWAAHQYGRDEADAHRDHDLQAYLNNAAAAKRPIVRFHYNNELDMFDVVTYFKGNCVLNMLRNYLGDSAFFDGLSLYLKMNAFKNGEVPQLRLALEAVSGRDLAWFFDQWYYRPGHPLLDIHCQWDDAAKTETVYVQQTQTGEPYRLLTNIDVYTGNKKERHPFWLTKKADTFLINLEKKPALVNFDGSRVLLARIDDHKTLEELLYQYNNAPLYLDRLEAINAAAANPKEPAARKILLKALKDPYYGLRIAALKAIDLTDPAVINAITQNAETDTNTLARAEAIKIVGKLKNPQSLPVFEKAMTSPSYAVEAAGLLAINEIDQTRALQWAQKLEKNSRGALTAAIKAVNAGSSQ